MAVWHQHYQSNILVCISSPYLMIFAVPSPRGDFGGLASQTKLQAPQIEIWNTINRWSFCEISECQARNIKNFLAMVLGLCKVDYAVQIAVLTTKYECVQHKSTK